MTRHHIGINRPLPWAAVVLLAILALVHFSLAEAFRKEPAGDSVSRAPVLVELFTSGGCSDCPPADALLQTLDRTQPVKNADLIVLSEHVDYWDRLGWRDPYSSHAITERQRLYAAHLNLPTVYTPQMVVDGQTQFVGSDESEALRAIEKAADSRKVPVALSSIRFQGPARLEAHVQADPLLASMGRDSAQVFVGVADDTDKSHVGAGENSGRDLQHIAVLRKLIPVGTISRTTGLDRDVQVTLDSSMSTHLKIVVFMQESGPGLVLGAASAHISR